MHGTGHTAFYSLQHHWLQSVNATVCSDINNASGVALKQTYRTCQIINDGSGCNTQKLHVYSWRVRNMQLNITQC